MYCIKIISFFTSGVAEIDGYALENDKIHHNVMIIT